jgi:hypothetical protein
MGWDDGATKDEYADDRGEARRPVQRIEDEFDRTGTWVDRLPYTSAEYHRVDGGGFDEW